MSLPKLGKIRNVKWLKLPRLVWVWMKHTPRWVYLNHSLSRYDGLLEARQTSKPQNRRPLFDVGLYLTVHKSLNFIKYYSSWLHVSFQLSILDNYFILRKYNELNHRDRAQININSDKNIIQWLLFRSNVLWSPHIFLRVGAGNEYFLLADRTYQMTAW
jgi:hypothetical protein